MRLASAYQSRQVIQTRERRMDGHAAVLGNVIAYSGITTVIGGGVAPALELMRPAVDAELAARARMTGPVDIRLARLGASAGALGAAFEIAGATVGRTAPGGVS
jgi:predicted NBD/HSP70 family sugar kinase